MTDTSLSERERKLLDQSRRYNEWAATATTDIVPDVFAGEPLADGTVATQAMWYHDGDKLHPEPPPE